MRSTKNKALAATGIGLAILSIWIVATALSWTGRTFPGFLHLENGVVASAGLTYWPAASDGEIFQFQIRTYDGIDYRSPALFQEYVRSKAVGTTIEYQFIRANSEIRARIATREFTATDALLLFGATFLCALAFLGVACALLYMAPKDPASLGTAIAFAITGIFALTALDLYGPYRFFEIHAVAECFLGAGMFHMALVFPYRRRIAKRLPWLIPIAYAGATVLGIATLPLLQEPQIYVHTHRLAIGGAGISFLVMIGSQVSAYVRPESYSARKRVTILAMGTFASVTPGFAVLVFSTFSGGGAAENFISWAGAFFPISVAYAVLRSDALRVDAIVRRTVSYAILTIIVGASYAAIIGGLEWFVRDQAETPRWISILIVSCFCTFAVSPLRDRIQSIVDKLFFRSAYDFRVTIEETSAILARLTGLNEIQDRIKDTVFNALQPESIELVLHKGIPKDDQEDEELGSIEESASCSSSEGIQVPFRSSNRTVAHLLLGRRLSGRFYTSEDRALLQVLANQGAISIENALALERLHDLNQTLENRVKNRTAELANTVEELIETQDQLIQAERLAAVGELAAGVAHEVNNPLNFARNSLRTIRSLVQDLSKYSRAISDLDLENGDAFLAERARFVAEQFKHLDTKELAGDLEELVEILGAGLDRTAKLVSDLRDFANPNLHNNSPFSLEETIQTTLQLTSHSLRDAEVEVELDIDQGLPLAFGDSSSMSQVILNVVKNSIDAFESRGHGVIRVSVAHLRDEQMLQLVIKDDGPGIREDIADRVFEPFFTTKDAGKGTGLGLPMCRRVMKECLGDITLASEQGKGVEVSIKIPANDAAPTTPHSPSAPTNPPLPQYP